MRRTNCVIYGFIVIVFFVCHMVYWDQEPNCHGSTCFPNVTATDADIGKAQKTAVARLQSKYIINTPACKIRRVDVFNKLALHEYRSVERQLCYFDSEPKPIAVIEDLTLKLNNEDTNKFKKCCYRSVGRIEAKNDGYILSDWFPSTSKNCKPINATTGVKMDSSFARFECVYKNSTTKSYHVDFVGTVFPPHRNSFKTRMKAVYWDQLRTASMAFPPNILMIGLDGVSRLHMLRSLPKTRKFALENDFIQFNGFTAMYGSAIFENMMAVLTGLLKQRHWYPCWTGNRSESLDKCPFIWNKFSENKYMTALVENSPGLSMFHYNKLGFLKQPVDYNLRTLMVAVQRQFKAKETQRWPFFSLNECINGKNSFDTMMKYMTDFLENVGKSYPYFLVSRFRTLTQSDRDRFNALQVEDDNFRKLLEKSLTGTGTGSDTKGEGAGAGNNGSSKGTADSASRNHSNNTVIILHSVHGQKYEYSQNSFPSYHEESLPCLLVRIPPSLKAAYPEWYTNLKLNANRLTSPLDLHATLEDLLSLSATPNFLEPFTFTHLNRQPSSSDSSKQRRAYSLFEEIPLHRTCESADILEANCRCGSTPLVSRNPNSTFSQKLSNVIVTHVNLILEPVLKPKLCVSLSFNRLLYGRKVNYGVMGEAIIVSSSSGQNNSGNHIYGNSSDSHRNIRGMKFRDYLIAIEVNPSLAHFEATVRELRDSTGNKVFVIAGDVRRINSWKNESNCVESKFKTFCLCESHPLAALSKIPNLKGSGQKKR